MIGSPFDSDNPLSPIPSVPPGSSTQVPAPAGAAKSAPSTRYDDLFAQAEQEHGLPSGLLKAIAYAESNFNPTAVSSAGARGLMQFMPATAARFGVRDVNDPAQAIPGAAKYVKFLLDRYDGDIPLAIAGYNAGEGRVDASIKFGSRLPKETRAYVPKVLAAFGAAPASAPPQKLAPQIGWNDAGQVYINGKTYDSKTSDREIVHSIFTGEHLKPGTAPLPNGFQPWTPEDAELYARRRMPSSNAGKSWQQGVEGVKGIGGALGAALGDAAGAQGLSKWGREVSTNSAQYAGELGYYNEFPQSYREVTPGNVGSYAAHTLISNLPQLGVMAAGGIGGALARVGAAAGMSAAGYGMAVGDIAQNQLEASGRTDLGAAGALAVPYAAVDLMTGTGGAMMRALGGKALKGAVAESAVRRAAIGAGRGVIEEPIGEVAQEGINQIGRMSVNPNIDLMAPDAVERYKESFFGSLAPGAVLGGAFGAMERPTPAPPPPAPQPVPPVQVETAVPGGSGMEPPAPAGRAAPSFLRPTTPTDPGALTPFDLNAPDGGQGLEQVTTNPQFQQLFSQYQAAELAGDQEGMAQAVRQAQLLAAQQMQASPGQGELFGKPTIPAEYVAAAQPAPVPAPVGRTPRGQPTTVAPLTQVETAPPAPAPAPEPPAPTGATTEVDGVKLYTTRGAERKDAVRQLVKLVKRRLFSENRITKPEWDAGLAAAVKDIPPQFRGAVMQALKDDQTYLSLADIEEKKGSANTAKRKAKAGAALSDVDIAAIARMLDQAPSENEEGDMTYEPYGPHADIHRLIQARDQQVSQFSSAKSNKQQTKHAEEMRGNTMALATALEQLANEYGEQNIDRAMKFLKDREKPGQRQSSPNIRFSQAWRMFKTGELAGNEFMAGMRGSPVRDNWSGEEVNRKVNERNAAEGRTEPDEARLNDIMGKGDKHARVLKALEYFSRHSAYPLGRVVSSTLAAFVKANPDSVPDIEIVAGRDPKKRANGRYVPDEHKVYLYLGGHNERTMLHELIHAVSMAYISAHWNRPTPALVRFTKVFDEFRSAHEKAFDAYSKTLDADELELLKSALRATAGMNETNRFAAVSEFLTYGLTHLPFQEYLQNLRVDESKLPARDVAAGSATSVSTVKDAEGKTALTKKGTPRYRTTLTVYSRFVSALSHILTGKSWANRENTAMSHFIEASAELLAAAQADTDATPVGIGKRLKVGGIDAAPGVDEETTVTPDVRQAHEASKAARQTQVETSRKLREEARAVPPEVAAERFKNASRVLSQTSIIKPWKRHSATPLSMLDAVYKAALTGVGVTKGLKAAWEAAETLSKYAARKSVWYRNALHAVVDKYGQSPEYRNAAHLIDNQNIAKIGPLNDFVKALGDLPADQYAAITRVLNSTAPFESIQDEFTPKQLEAIRAAQEVMNDLVEQAVAAGVIDSDQAKANGYMLFKRRYLSELKDLAGKTGLKAHSGVAGLSLKDTGVTQTVAKSHVTQTDDGRYIEVLHVRPNGTVETFFVPPGTPLSEVNEGENVEYVPGKPIWTIQKRLSKDETLTFHRPYTDEEMAAAGAIQDPRFLLQVTAHHLMQDIAHADLFHYLRDLGDPKVKGEEYHPEHKVVFDSRLDAELFEKDMGRKVEPRDWVEVPRTKNDAGGYRYGALAGKWVPRGIWTDINARVLNKPLFPEWNKVLTYWKKTKTTWSPVTHFNNVAANFSLLYYHDISATALLRSIGVYRDYLFGDEAAQARAKPVIEEFNRSGANIGSFDTREVRRDELRELVDNMLGTEKREPSTKLGEYARLMKLLTVWEGLKAAGNVMDKAYQTEDNVFRLAAYMQAINDGKSITDAGKFASEAFVDYNITAPAISMARQTVLPFIAWPYRMIPAMLRIAVFKPWKIATLVTALHGLNALGYAIAGGDEDEERKFLPETRQGALGGFLPVPKAIRMPWNTGDNSTYYDMTVLFPTGDLLGLGSATVFGAKLPAPMTPSGPLVLLAESLFGYDTFRGEKITSPANEWYENVGATAKFLAQGSLPNMPLPGTRQGGQLYDLMRDKHGITGAEMNALYTLAGFVGPRFIELDQAEGAASLGMRLKKIRAIHKEAIAKAARGELRYGTPDYDKLIDRITSLNEKMQEEMSDEMEP